MDIGSDDQLAQQNLQIPAHASNRTIPPYLFPRKFPKRSRLTSSRPDPILTSPYHSKPTSSSPSFLLLIPCVMYQAWYLTDDQRSYPH
eukprot:scaffold129795_cov23-Tisochrysis_lutea.AAC.1